jgi:hypothetical protein
MPLGNRVLIGLTRNECDGAPTITAHSVAEVTFPVCPAGEWEVRSTVTLSGGLGSFQIEREQAVDSAGTSWGSWNTTQNAAETRNRTVGAGTGGTGTQYSFWWKARARIVTASGSPCGSWVESSNQLNINNVPSCTT